ncbi:MAG: GRP family sugar transporter [Planctomycetota bacterium]
MNEAVFWSLVTVLAWGTWLAPLQAAQGDERVRTFFITLGNLAVAWGVAWGLGFEGLTWSQSWPAAAGGLIWAWSGWAAVVAVQRLGMAKAMGLWSPLNIVVSMGWGAVLFEEFAGLPFRVAIGLGAGALAMIAGILLIVLTTASVGPASTDRRTQSSPQAAAGRTLLGVGAAALAGLGWGSYFIPIRLAEASAWVTALPLAVGMLAGAGMPLLAGRAGQRIHKPSAFLALLSGGMWAAGNYGSLQLMAQLGTGRGFAVAQACVVVNALVGILLFGVPSPRSQAARSTLAGVLLAALGAAAIGLIR